MKNLLLILIIFTSYNALASKKLITDASMGADVTSQPISIDAKKGYSVQLIYSGTPNGAFTLEGSVDGSTWESINGSNITITASGDSLYNIYNAQYALFRLVFTRASGTGTLNAYYKLKE
jgi:hypothetical protein